MLIHSSQLHTPEGAVVQGLRYEALPMTKHKEFKKAGTIIVHGEVPRLLLQEVDRDLLGPTGSLLHDSRLMPMLIPPVPWTSFDSGGLVMHGPSAVRASKRSMYAQAEKAGRMDLLYRGLNTLNAQPWAINTRVLRVMESLWASLPRHSPKSPLPEHTTPTSSHHLNFPTSHATNSYHIPAQPPPTPTFPAKLLSNLPTAWRAAVEAAAASRALPSSKQATAVPSTPYLRSTRQGVGLGQLVLTAGPLTHNEARERRRAWVLAKQAASQRTALASELQLKLQVARLLAGHERFYIPHNIDFRGRAYPTSCYLHQLGDDTSRGLLLFAEGKPLGQGGLDWLFIQVAKCYGNGMDKLPFEERHKFGKDNLPRILASARTPLQQGDGQWWLQAEEPWQLLATCCEITAALDSGDPASFPSRLPLQQDGTCNGLQHYAALARDYSGAFAVNLVPSPIPQDVYTAVSKVVDARVRKDAEQGVSEALKYLSRSRNVDRKLVKQTVMTSVYGVTHVGARQQIEARLEERGWDNEDEVYMVSRYLSQVTLSSIGELFRNAEAVMRWLASCAGAVASTDKPVEWRSPLGFPISQPYYDTKLAQVDSSLQKFWVTKPTTTVAKRSQRTAFPPNYIHSLDSAHMMMTAMECKAQGVAFAGVHDCFWTHAATADAVGTILRDTFVQLHSRPLLEELVENIKQAAPGVTLPPIPPKGQLDLTMVQKSPYFFS
ncbi:hypothetical protein DUNSADRAFT_670 [Dunaliella salina]|nr:hypothetical protein DUNSADRAFT_670 [Dunaliella salina]|eukprot:KAF5839496.1 hypothetical protein DUNSADRAFT_670 [Dunaliella salina]